MNKKRYHIDGHPVSANALIDIARSLDSNFGSNGIFLVSEAARILRDYGHSVGDALGEQSQEVDAL